MSAAKHFHVAGWVPCSDYVQSKNAITGIATLFPNNVSAKIYECKKILHELAHEITCSRADLESYHSFKIWQLRRKLSMSLGLQLSRRLFRPLRIILRHRLYGYKTVSVTWVPTVLNYAVYNSINFTVSWSGDGEKTYFGGEDQILAWCREGSYFHDSKKVSKGCCASTIQAAEAPHEFDYDLVVIGGKSQSTTIHHLSNCNYFYYTESATKKSFAHFRLQSKNEKNNKRQ